MNSFNIELTTTLSLIAKFVLVRNPIKQMNKQLLHFILLFVFTTFVSCNSKPKNVVTYFGGKIINPKSRYVILYSMNKVMDTMFLGKNNQFLGKLKNINEGLYYFLHGNENQYIYMVPQDSLMLRLNTWDFDESIVFTGIGSKRNNILIDCFLKDEKDNKLFYKLNQLEPNKFYVKADSLITLRKKTYQEYVTNHPNETDDFNQILKVALTYPIYSRIERYPIAHVKHLNKKDFHIFKDSFYTHRKSVHINNHPLMYYPPYAQYARNFLYNKTYSLGYKPMTDGYSSGFTVDLLKTIDRSIKSEASKNAFLKQTVIGHFYRNSKGDGSYDAFDTYLELSTSNKDKRQVEKLVQDNKAIHKGQKILNFTLNDMNDGVHAIKKLIKNKNVLLFFWNSQYVSKAYIASKINYLSKKFPKVLFLQVRIDGSKEAIIPQLDLQKQFYITPKNEANRYLTSKMPRSILINRKGIITNSFAAISSKKIATELKDLSKH
ncbi:hypothetical protein OAJ14_04185 [Polaribacter sp.]|nr:hypothetical protein [Polaribacter sp.]